MLTFYNGTSWLDAPTVTNSYNSNPELFLNNVYYTANYNPSADTGEIRRSVSGTLETGLTFSSNPDFSFSGHISSFGMIKNSTGIFLMRAVNSSSEGASITLYKSADGISWQNISPTDLLTGLTGKQ